MMHGGTCLAWKGGIVCLFRMDLDCFRAQSPKTTKGETKKCLPDPRKYRTLVLMWLPCRGTAEGTMEMIMI